ncbi:transcriptional regulator ATRX homolog [Rhopilema esculentum]|uniref:transcriptional regulator ATRX homolog n=1 Tax=Rhopilema esculentum TaxID=499914 RepID=UPI0031DF35AB|eukprot:gene4903-21236_t
MASDKSISDFSDHLEAQLRRKRKSRVLLPRIKGDLDDVKRSIGKLPGKKQALAVGKMNEGEDIKSRWQNMFRKFDAIHKGEIEDKLRKKRKEMFTKLDKNRSSEKEREGSGGKLTDDEIRNLAKFIAHKENYRFDQEKQVLEMAARESERNVDREKEVEERNAVGKQQEKGLNQQSQKVNQSSDRHVTAGMLTVGKTREKVMDEEQSKEELGQVLEEDKIKEGNERKQGENREVDDSDQDQHSNQNKEVMMDDSMRSGNQGNPANRSNAEIKQDQLNREVKSSSDEKESTVERKEGASAEQNSDELNEKSNVKTNGKLPANEKMQKQLDENGMVKETNNSREDEKHSNEKRLREYGEKYVGDKREQKNTEMKVKDSNERSKIRKVNEEGEQRVNAKVDKNKIEIVRSGTGGKMPLVQSLQKVGSTRKGAVKKEQKEISGDATAKNKRSKEKAGLLVKRKQSYVNSVIKKRVNDLNKEHKRKLNFYGKKINNKNEK